MRVPIIADVIPRHSGVLISAYGIWFEQKLPWEAYESIWRALDDIRAGAEAVPFWAGDLLNEVEFRYGETYAQLLAIVPDRAIETLRNWKWVCGRVGVAMRERVLARVAPGKVPTDDGEEGPVLLWTHCRLAAGITCPIAREQALVEALLGDMTTRELEAWIRASDLRAYTPPQTDVPAPHVCGDAPHTCGDAPPAPASAPAPAPPRTCAGGANAIGGQASAEGNGDGASLLLVDERVWGVLEEAVCALLEAVRVSDWGRVREQGEVVGLMLRSVREASLVAREGVITR